MSDLMYTAAAAAAPGTPGAPPPSEDADAAPSIEVATSDRGRATACVYVDAPAQLLWVADREGWVYGETSFL